MPQPIKTVSKNALLGTLIAYAARNGITLSHGIGGYATVSDLMAELGCPPEALQDLIGAMHNAAAAGPNGPA